MKLRIRETYLIFLIVIGLVSLSLYTTYAMFTATTTIEDVVGFDTSLSLNTNLSEYELITLNGNDAQVIKINVTNSNDSTLCYGIWYEVVSGEKSSLDIGIYTEKSDIAPSGTIAAGSTTTTVVGILNNSNDNITLKLGVSGKEMSENNCSLGITNPKSLIDTEWSNQVLVNNEFLQEKKYSLTKEINLEYTTPEMTEVTLGAGTYLLEVYGASDSQALNAGYSYGTLALNEETSLFVYVGGNSNKVFSLSFNTSYKIGGFNGGGNATLTSIAANSYAGSGASDIRIGTDSLYARVIVAGGAGGYCSDDSDDGSAGKYGGGLSGGGSGGTQTSGGFGDYYGGDFGNGGGAYKDIHSIVNVLPGGGGGWYGGGATRKEGGGGGSGYVYTSSTASNYPSGCLLNSTYYLTNAETIAGNESFTDFDGTTVTGHSGDGAVRISGTGTIYKYRIPQVKGLTTLTLHKTDDISLTDDVTYICEDELEGCTYLGPDITDTSTLSTGTHTVYYSVKSESNIIYKYPRTIIVEDKITSDRTLSKLNLTSNGTKSSFASIATTDEGIFSAEDDLGTSYYFRGNVTNNYVYFADMYWRIIRINGDGSIRMIYDGTSPHSNGESSTDRYIRENIFNNNYSNNKYIGYSYLSTSLFGTIVVASSNITDAVDLFYYLNIKNTQVEKYVVDTIYCNDKEVYSGTGSGTTETLYKSYERIIANTNPTLKCNQESDKLTVSSGLLDYPIGLITGDEIVMAGGIFGTENTSYYLYMGSNYWTMTGYYFKSYAYVLISSAGGNLLFDRVSNIAGVRPVISISPDYIKYGNGTSSSPYRLTNEI